MTQSPGSAKLALILRRRGRTVAIVAAAAAVIGVAWVARMPSVYQARTVLRIDDPRPARDYVAPTIVEPSGERLKSRRLGFIARPLVAQAAEAAGLLSPAAAGTAREAALDALVARVDARMEGEDAFVVTFQDGDPARARAFLAALADGYVAARARESAELARRTATFFEDEVAALRPRLLDAELAVERFRLEHYGALPEQLESNLRLLEETQLEAHSTVGSLDAAQARRQTVLAEARSPLRRQEEEAARAVTAARARYAPGSAEVRNLEAELERVRAERRRDERDLEKRTRRGPELTAVDAEIARARGRLDALAGREAELRGRIEATVANGDELARRTIDRDLLRERLRSLVGKHEEAALAAALESDVAGRARVAIVEPAWAGTAPVAPAKPFYAAVALCVALALALGVGWLLEATDRRVRSVDDVRAVAGELPVLGVVPRLDGGSS